MKLEEKIELAKKLEEFKKDYNHKQLGDDYQMLGPWVKELSFIASVDTLPERTRPFAHMVYIAGKRLRATEIESGPIGEGLETLFDRLTQALLNIAFPEPKPGEKLLLEKSIPLLFMTLIVGMITLANKGVGKLPGKEKADIEESRFFSFELILHMVVSTEMIQDTFRTLLEACSAAKEKEKAAVDILTLLTLIIILEVISECGNIDRERLMEGMQVNLLKHIESVCTYLDDCIATRTFDNKIATDLNIALQQAKMRLTQDDIDSFLDACMGALKAIGVSKEQWNKDLQRAGKYSTNLLALLEEQAESDINEITGFLQAG